MTRKDDILNEFDSLVKLMIYNLDLDPTGNQFVYYDIKLREILDPLIRETNIFPLVQLAGSEFQWLLLPNIKICYNDNEQKIIRICTHQNAPDNIINNITRVEFFINLEYSKNSYFNVIDDINLGVIEQLDITRYYNQYEYMSNEELYYTIQKCKWKIL